LALRVKNHTGNTANIENKLISKKKILEVCKYSITPGIKRLNDKNIIKIDKNLKVGLKLITLFQRF